MTIDPIDKRQSALVCWPVEWADKTRPVPDKTNLHVTCIYIPNALDYPKSLLYTTIADLNLYRAFTIAKVTGVDAYGPDNTYPVLKVDRERYNRYGLEAAYFFVSEALEEAGVEWDKWEPFSPHCTVDLKTVLNPPEYLILRPLELWYMDDNPVLV